MFVVEEGSVEEAERRFQELPFVQNDLLSFEVYAVGPSGRSSPRRSSERLKMSGRHP